jgi:hypothetical protein
MDPNAPLTGAFFTSNQIKNIEDIKNGCKYEESR